MNGIVLKAIRPSAALESWYRDRLQELVYEMACSMLLHIRAAWNKADPEIGFAHDESPTRTITKTLTKWGDRWVGKFDKMSQDVANAFAERSTDDFDRRFAKILKDAGFTVRFKPTKRQRLGYQAVVAENVNLIRSIPQRFLTDVQNSVWDSVMKGSDMAGLARSIKRNYEVSWRRAALISRDQTHKARAIFEETRRSELGITEAEWIHSGAGKEPRREHVRWGAQKKRYNIKKGMYSKVDKEWVWPGTAINCRCISRSVFPTGD